MFKDNSYGSPPSSSSCCRDYRPAWDLNVTDPISGNYYPLTAAMHIQDSERQVALLTERAQGGCSCVSCNFSFLSADCTGHSQLAAPAVGMTCDC